MIDRATIDKLAMLSRIELSEEEKVKIAKDLESILGYVAELKNAPRYEMKEGEDTHINIFREDEEVAGFGSGEFTNDILDEAPRRDGDFLLVKQVMGEKGGR
ncbi:MAG: Asp-tRNA(Asn)/Glu-tRNA(Gln) amidotransferase subunit GatC [Patescibacteria group bacterium]